MREAFRSRSRVRCAFDGHIISGRELPQDVPEKPLGATLADDVGSIDELRQLQEGLLGVG